MADAQVQLLLVALRVDREAEPLVAAAVTDFVRGFRLTDTESQEHWASDPLESRVRDLGEKLSVDKTGTSQREVLRMTKQVTTHFLRG